MNPNQNPFARPDSVMSTPAYTSPYEEKRSRLKNPIVLAIIITVGLILAVIIISLVATKTNEVISENTNKNLKELLELYYPKLESLEKNYTTREMSNIIIMPRPDDSIDKLSKQKETFKDDLEGVKQLRKDLDNYNNIVIKSDFKGEADISYEINNLKKALTTRIIYYEKYTTLYSTIADAYISDGDAGKMSELLKLAQKENAVAIYNNISDVLAFEHDLRDNGCIEDDSTEICQTINDKYIAILDIMNEDTTFAEVMADTAAKYKNEYNPLDIIDSILYLYQKAEVER